MAKSKKTENTVADTSTATSTATPTPEQATASAGLTLHDLIFVSQIIQVSSTRGAFRADELANVGALYNKLITFLESTGAISKEQPSTEEKSNA